VIGAPSACGRDMEDALIDEGDIDGFLVNIYRDVRTADLKDVISKESLNQRDPILMDGTYLSLWGRASILTAIYSSKPTNVECMYFDIGLSTHDIRGAGGSAQDRRTIPS
jgi:hypothetical protein